MATANLNSALTAVSGAIDRWFFRRLGDRTVICRRPRFTAAPSAAQLQVREHFRLASTYAAMVSVDPVLRAPYEGIAEARHLPLRQVMISDFLNPPVVDGIDLGRYHGAIGDPIKVKASDDAGVVSVSVVLRAEDDSLLEHGAAVLQDGAWTYRAASACESGPIVRIMATALDRPGHSGWKTEIWSQS
jgi:hypothetical protein